jgi:hypothetical protein
MFSTIKRRVGVIAAVAVLASLAPVLSNSTASAAPATAAAPHTNEDSPDYSACPGSSAAAAGFTDTTSTDVDCIKYHGVTQGVTATTYEPDSSVPRWQMALYLTRMATAAGVTLGSGADQGFTDISGQSAEIQTAINQIKQLGVTTGTTATTYSPDDNVTKEQMAMFVERLLAKTPVGPGGQNDTDALGLALYINSTDVGTGNYNYDDIDSGSVTFEGHNAIVEMWQLGITGDANTVRTFSPSADITRGQMATWMTNALGHTNARPAGLHMQAPKYSGFSNTAPTLSITYRDSNNAPVASKSIDIFEWQNNVTPADNSAMTALGTCAAAVAVVSASMTKCKVEVGDPTTNAKGNISVSESVTNGKTMSYFAWTAAAGTTFANATHGSGTDYSTIDVSSTAPATNMVASMDLPANASVDTGNGDETKVAYGKTYTVTFQASKAQSGFMTHVAVAQPLVLVTVTHTIYALGTNNIENVTTTKLYTDANGTATYSVTDADPLATASTGATRHDIAFASAATDTSLALDNTPGFFVGGTTARLSFDDAAAALTSSGMASNVTDYAAGSALLPVARTATLSLYDQYGTLHAASAGASIQFTGSSVGRLASSTHGTETLTFAAAHGLAVDDLFVFTEIGAGAGGNYKEDCAFRVKTRTDHLNIIPKVVAGDMGVGTVAGCTAADPFLIGADISGAGAGAWLISRMNDTFGAVDMIVGADGTASLAWNDVTSTAGESQAGAYVSAALNSSPNKVAYRYLAPSATTLDNSKSSAAWSELDAGGTAHLAEADDDINGAILTWDDANNTLLVRINYGTGACSEGGQAAAAHCSFTLTKYTYDDNDQFNLTADGTAATTTLAGFELQLATHLAAGNNAAFVNGDLWGVTYQALAANVSQFHLGT